MTIGHLQEMLFSKVAALNGKIQDATPFCHENINTMADLLKANGFQEFGNERLIDGVTGLMHEANLFICPIYYQRLRHMVDDKIHVRDNTGPRSVLTRQPPAGRGNNGGHVSKINFYQQFKQFANFVTITACWRDGIGCNHIFWCI